MKRCYQACDTDGRMQVSTQASSAGAADSDECAFAFQVRVCYELLLAELLVLVGEERKEKARETGFVLRRGDRRTGWDG